MFSTAEKMKIPLGVSGFLSRSPATGAWCINGSRIRIREQLLGPRQVIYLSYLVFTPSVQKHQAKNILFMSSGLKMKQLGY